MTEQFPAATNAGNARYVLPSLSVAGGEEAQSRRLSR